MLVELRIKPSDIGWVRVGHPVEIKLSAYDFTVYGSLHGTVDTVSPDALSDNGGPAANAEATWYRALVRADASKLKAGGKPLTVLPGMVGTGRDPHRPALGAELPAAADDEGHRGPSRNDEPRRTAAA